MSKRSGGIVQLPLFMPALVRSVPGKVSATEPEKPNFVFILIDDMPWFGTPVRMDASVPGSAMAFRQMPRVARLAAEGRRGREAS
jgi:hypothetical protein